MKIIFLLFLFFIHFSFGENIKITQTKDNNKIYFYLENNNSFHIHINYDANLSNIQTNQTFPFVKVCPPKSKTPLFTLELLEGKKPIFKGSYQWKALLENAKHDDAYLYRLPFATNRRIGITQGFNESFSHFGISKYAVDFDMREGDKIYAMRDGIIIDTKDDSNLHGQSKGFVEYANFIKVKHEDNTFCTYSHLKKDGVFVKIGDKIQRGDIIGLSGNTGYTNGPHLHIVVYKEFINQPRESIPIKFKTKEGILTYPKRRMFITAIP